MEKSDRLILLTNDDGIYSPGITSIYNELKQLGRVIMAAPTRQQSAVSHALSIANPLRVKEIQDNGELKGFAINGTPADCVKLAISELLDKKPDLVVSGINHGQNTSINVMYSGTIAGATEGLLLGIPSMAVSIASHDPSTDCSGAATYAAKTAENILMNGIPENVMLNLNIPAIPEKEIKGIKITRQSDTIWKDHYEKRTDPFGRDYYWFAGDFSITDNSEDTDEWAINNGYVSLTPIHFNLTRKEMIESLRNFEL